MPDRFADRFPDLIPSLRKRYNAEGRAYHNWAHVQALIDHFERVQADLNDPGAVEIALYYHDVVYVPLAPSNEADSADAMLAELTGRADAIELETADMIVRATAAHEVPDGIKRGQARDCAIFLDMDLAILGATPDGFDAFDAAIRQEFQMVPDAIFYPRRRDVLKTFLDRDRIYLTERFHEQFDAAARANLSRLVERLSQTY